MIHAPIDRAVRTKISNAIAKERDRALLSGALFLFFNSHEVVAQSANPAIFNIVTMAQPHTVVAITIFTRSDPAGTQRTDLLLSADRLTDTGAAVRDQMISHSADRLGNFRPQLRPQRYPIGQTVTNVPVHYKALFRQNELASIIMTLELEIRV